MSSKFSDKNPLKFNGQDFFLGYFRIFTIEKTVQQLLSFSSLTLAVVFHPLTGQSQLVVEF
jgi:hypothetical protein